MKKLAFKKKNYKLKKTYTKALKNPWLNTVWKKKKNTKDFFVVPLYIYNEIFRNLIKLPVKYVIITEKEIITMRKMRKKSLRVGEI